uniref:Alcohol dehydrogenase-like C-terminal domain-containing protein n=1 Tax=Ananas comosus var. bracteatus TaxID=296719 RepID=A0A6V7Q8S9_ANACO|nr:unnamed protein product [Ananas comosus var. bracteatus]
MPLERIDNFGKSLWAGAGASGPSPLCRCDRLQPPEALWADAGRPTRRHYGPRRCGHMGVKIAKAMGHHVTVISSSDKKRAEATDHLVLMRTSFPPAGTVPVAAQGERQAILMGVINQPLQFVTPLVMLGRKTITGTFIGSMEETHEMLQFCEKKGLTSMIEIVKMDQVNEALERLERNDVRYRFVVDVANSNLDP